MNCLYCHQKTEVINSRHQKRLNQVWRRRHCPHCGAVFSTQESINLERGMTVVWGKQKTFRPFLRDKLYISVYKACGHRKDAVETANALTATIISKLFSGSSNGLVTQDKITEITAKVLENFDYVAFTTYKAYHP